MNFTLVILSYTKTKATFSMNLECLKSFVLSADLAQAKYEMILIESNESATFNYGLENLRIIKPRKIFNFHGFLNVGIKSAVNEHLILSNNDVVFSKFFIKEVIKGFTSYNLSSFSPYDPKSNKLSKAQINQCDYIKGYDLQKQLTGWCIIATRTVFKKIGLLDERFAFFYADSDYAMMLRKYNIQHALLTKCNAYHLEAMSKHGLPKLYYDYKKHHGIPNYVIKEKRYWILNSKRMIDGVIQFHNKWGSRKMIKLKLLVASKFQDWGIGYLNRIVLFHR